MERRAQSVVSESHRVGMPQVESAASSVGSAAATFEMMQRCKGYDLSRRWMTSVHGSLIRSVKIIL